jgi:hypothetical protein
VRTCGGWGTGWAARWRTRWAVSLVGGLGPGQDALGDQPVDPGPDGVEVEAVCHQDPGGQVVALGEQTDQQVLGAEVLVAEAAGLHAGQRGGKARRPGHVHRPRDRFHVRQGNLTDMAGSMPGPPPACMPAADQG